MKKLLLASTAAIVAGAAFTSPVAARPPVPASVYNWSGCYAGAHVGAGWGRTDFSNPGTLPLPVAPVGQSLSTRSPGGLVGGGQVGCDYQFVSNWVVGLAGDFSWADIDGQADDPFFGGKNPGAPRTVRATTDFFGSVTGRFGYAWNNNLLYAKGGVAFSHNKYEVNNFACLIFTACFASASDSQIGWTLGAGYEWAFARQWSMLVEYGHYGFASKTLAVVDPAHPAAPFDINMKTSFDLVKVGINYRFGGLFR
jgi:outer membrane immunogenic protein